MTQASTRNLIPDLAWPPECRRWPSVFPPACACAWGDDSYGLWIDVVIGGPVQRFRWIEPGEFVMGSHGFEMGGSRDERPRHLVRLSKGFWLADTACSQAVWLAVMGNNPSQFPDDLHNPVERVSWDDTQDFLRQVEKRLPGVKAELPTEAEWEYACGAGRETASSYGDLSHVNCRSTASYRKSPRGERQEKTVPVKAFMPIGWGLYQMHGNVWEWCADGMRRYSVTPQEDPVGPMDDELGAQRVLRGGAWIDNPNRMRAAHRRQGRRDFRRGYVGFRFSLRPASPERGEERQPEVVVARDA